MQRTAVFTVTLSKVSTKPVAVAYATKDGTATAGSDYTAVSGSLLFQPGQTSKQINVPIRDTLAGSLDEAFTVELSTPVNATVNDDSGLCVIPGDPATSGPVIVSISNPVVP